MNKLSRRAMRTATRWMGAMLWVLGIAWLNPAAADLLTVVTTGSPSSLAIGNVQVGQTGGGFITLTNPAGATASVVFPAGAITPSSSLFTVTSNACGGVTLVAGASCSIYAQFSPTSVGAVTASMTVTATSGSPNIIVSLSGTGTNGGTPVMMLSDALVDFGEVYLASSETKTVTVSNVGSARLSATWASSSGDFRPSAPGQTCLGDSTLSLDAGTSCTLTLTYTPSAVGSASGTLTFSGTGAEGIEIALKGKGRMQTGSSTVCTSSLLCSASSATINASPTSLAFGSVSVGSSQSKSVTLTINGSASVTAVSVPDGFSASHTCGTAAVSSCTLTLQFSPTTESTYAGLVVVDTSGGAAAMIAVDGMGNNTARMQARASGRNSSLNLTGTLDFSSDYANLSDYKLYVAALYRDNLLFLSNGQWHTYVEGSEPPPAYSGVLSPSAEATILVGADVGQGSGAVVYLGYGRNFGEVLQKRQYAPVYVVE